MEIYKRETITHPPLTESLKNPENVREVSEKKLQKKTNRKNTKI